MSKLIRRLLGALLVPGFFMESPVMAQTNLIEAKFRITRVGSQDLGGPFLISGGPSGSTTGIARISRLDVVN